MFQCYRSVGRRADITRPPGRAKFRRTAKNSGVGNSHSAVSPRTERLFVVAYTLPVQWGGMAKKSAGPAALLDRDPKHPERVCWGCNLFCPADAMKCGSDVVRTPHPVELFGDDWRTLELGPTHSDHPHL